MPELTVTCHHSGDVVPADEAVSFGGVYFKNVYTRNKYGICAHSHELCLKVAMVEAVLENGGVNLIRSSLVGGLYFFRCPDCDGVFHHSQENHNQQPGRTVCNSCNSWNYLNCDSCGDRVHEDHMHYDEYEDEHHCPECREGSRVRTNSTVRIHGYHSINPVEHFGYGKQHTTLDGKKYYIGLELEFNGGVSRDAVRDSSPALLAEYGLWMDDSSVDIELVTRPTNIREHEKKLTELFANCSPMHLHANDGAGLHVNISRTAFSNETLADFVLFINNNPEFIEEIAGRGPNAWGEWARCGYKTKKQADDISRSRSEKYSAVNVQTGRVEVRIFKSSTNASTILRRTEFCVALIDFCERMHGAGKHPTLYEFIRYVTRSRRYKHLGKFKTSDYIDTVFHIEEEIEDYSECNGGISDGWLTGEVTRHILLT